MAKENSKKNVLLRVKVYAGRTELVKKSIEKLGLHNFPWDISLGRVREGETEPRVAFGYARVAVEVE